MHATAQARVLPRVALFLVVVLFGAVVLAPAAYSAQTNTVTLDNGDCGNNLQLGSDPTASSSATPTFLLIGDGSTSFRELTIRRSTSTALTVTGPRATSPGHCRTGRPCGR